MDGTTYWLEGSYEEAEPDADEKARQLEVECSSLRREIAEVRKELAAKTVQLSKRDQSDKAALEKWAEQRAQELATTTGAAKSQVIRSLESTVSQLEVALAQRTEELEESRRLYSSQKRALKNALSAAEEREAAEAAADEAGRSAATAAAEEEMERLHQELAQLQTRAALELKSKELEVAELKQQLAVHAAGRAQVMADAEAAAAKQIEAALAAAEAAREAQLAELQRELSRTRSTAQSYLREEQEELVSDLAAANKAQLQLQREFDAFKDLTAQTHRQHREEQARLLDENASLKARIAAEAARVAMGTPVAAVGTAMPAGSGHSRLLSIRGLLAGLSGDAGAGGVLRGKTFSAVSSGEEQGNLLEQWVARIERQRKGLVPVLVVASVVLLILLIAVVRAGAAASAEQKGALCFLAKLGIQIGAGCGMTGQEPAAAVSKALVELAEVTPRVKHIEGASVLPAGQSNNDETDNKASTNKASSSNSSPAGAAAGVAAAVEDQGTAGRRMMSGGPKVLLHAVEGGG
eukprot:gene13245-13375_t